ncbi:MAG TPA: HisA/HisF-related TIM barrel protein, partial [Patescibacteria group bacterium]|nr:HisA/HisF-related TIM barrel protein [Patescibacteria group bacterium]
IVKKGINHPTEAVVEWTTAGMDILHGINAVPHGLVYPGKISPLADVGGGAISGADITKIALEDNYKSRKATDVPMIFGGGNTNVDDVKRCFDLGADAVSICTVASEDTVEAERIIRFFNT